jgi:hypothetical protein
MKLEEKLSAYKKSFESNAPQEALEVMHRVTEDLENSGILADTVQVGDRAPDFTLKNAEGKEIRLSKLLSEGPVVISFYRGKW